MTTLSAIAFAIGAIWVVLGFCIPFMVYSISSNAKKIKESNERIEHILRRQINGK